MKIFRTVITLGANRLNHLRKLKGLRKLNSMNSNESDEVQLTGAMRLVDGMGRWGDRVDAVVLGNISGFFFQQH